MSCSVCDIDELVGDFGKSSPEVLVVSAGVQKFLGSDPPFGYSAAGNILND